MIGRTAKVPAQRGWGRIGYWIVGFVVIGAVVLLGACSDDEFTAVYRNPCGEPLMFEENYLGAGLVELVGSYKVEAQSELAIEATVPGEGLRVTVLSLRYEEVRVDIRPGDELVFEPRLGSCPAGTD